MTCEHLLQEQWCVSVCISGCLGHENCCVSSIQFVVLDAWKRDALLRHEDDLRTKLNLDGLVNKLDNPAEGFMTVDEKKSVEDVEGLSRKVGRIVEILRLKGNKEFDVFLKLLKETGNRSLASKLRQSAQLYKSEHPRHGKISCSHCMVPGNLMLHFPSLSSSLHAHFFIIFFIIIIIFFFYIWLSFNSIRLICADSCR